MRGCRTRPRLCQRYWILLLFDALPLIFTIAEGLVRSASQLEGLLPESGRLPFQNTKENRFHMTWNFKKKKFHVGESTSLFQLEWTLEATLMFIRVEKAITPETVSPSQSLTLAFSWAF